MMAMEMATINLSVTDDEMAWIDKRMADGQFGDIGEYFCDLVNREIAGTLPDRRMERE